MYVEFLIPHRPVSVQASSTGNRRKWKKTVKECAEKAWGSQPILKGISLHLILVHLYDATPCDVDNIIKPIQDGLINTIIEDDSLIVDVESHLRPLIGIWDFTNLPVPMMESITKNKEGVYLRLSRSRPIEEFLS